MKKTSGYAVTETNKGGAYGGAISHQEGLEDQTEKEPVGTHLGSCRDRESPREAETVPYSPLLLCLTILAG